MPPPSTCNLPDGQPANQLLPLARCENKNCSADELAAAAELESTWEQEEPNPERPRKLTGTTKGVMLTAAQVSVTPAFAPVVAAWNSALMTQ